MIIIERIRSRFLVGKFDSIFGGRFLSYAAWSLLSSIVSRGMGLLAGIILARTLGIIEYGEFGLIRNSIATIGVLTSFGLGLTTTKYISEYKAKYPEKVGSILSMTISLIIFISLIGVLISVFAAPTIIKYQNIQVGNVDDYKIAGLLLFSNAIWDVIQAGLIGFKEFRRLTIHNFVYGLCIVMCSYVLGNRYGLRGGIIAVVISEGVRSFFAFLTILQIFKRESMRFNFKWSKENFKILTSFSFPAYLSGILVMPVTWWSYSQVASKMNGNAQMGLFSAADQWRAVILFVPHAIGIIALPMLSEAVGRLNKRGFVQTVRMNLFSVIFSSVMISIGIILGRNIILSFYGNDYLQAGDVILFLTFAAIIQSINAILGQVIAGLGKMWFGVLLNFSWAVAFVVGLSKLFPQVAFGLAQTYLLAYLVQLLLSIMIVIFLLKYEWV